MKCSHEFIPSCWTILNGVSKAKAFVCKYCLKPSEEYINEVNQKSNKGSNGKGVRNKGDSRPGGEGEKTEGQ